MTAAMMDERVSVMFALSASGPMASGMPKIANDMSMGLVDLAFAAINRLCDRHGKALSKAYGNFDRVVGLGWLAGDAVGCPPVDGKAAYSFGIKLRKLPGELKSDILEVRKSASRAISKLAADDPRRLELKQQAEAKEAKLIRAKVEVELPSAAPAPRQSASGSRKRAAPEPVDVLESRTAAASEAVSAAEKEVKRKERRLEQAIGYAQLKARRVDRVWRRFEKCMRPEKLSSKQLQRASHWRGVHDKAESTHHEAQLEHCLAHVDYLEAQIELRDAWMDQMEVQQDEQQAEMDALLASPSSD